MSSVVFERFNPANNPFARLHEVPPGHQANAPLRVLLFQQALPKYRLAVFGELANRTDFDLEVIYGAQPELFNAEPEGFRASFSGWKYIWRRLNLSWWPGLLKFPVSGPNRPDAVIMPWSIQFLSLLPALKRARRAGIGTVAWGHGYSKKDNAIRTWARNWVGSLADSIVLYARNDSVIASLARSGVTADRVFIAPNAIDQRPIQAARVAWVREPGRLVAFREQNALHDGPVVLFVARIMPERRLDVLIRALPALSARYPNLQLVLIGDGLDSERARVRAAMHDSGVEEVDAAGRPMRPDAPTGRPRVRFVGPIYNEDQLAPWFLCADAMCFPAGLGLSVEHAFGYGLPVLAGDDPGQHGPEFACIIDGENGKTFRPGDSQDLARQLDWMLADPERRRSLSNRALLTAFDDFSIPRMVDGLDAAVRFACIRARARHGQ
jgi:glycosyltransferase involved in cell wall biosynthesis